MRTITCVSIGNPKGNSLRCRGRLIGNVLVSNDPFVWIRLLTSVFNVLNKLFLCFRISHYQLYMISCQQNLSSTRYLKYIHIFAFRGNNLVLFYLSLLSLEKSELESQGMFSLRPAFKNVFV